jgi:hypothetical protein
MIPTYENQLAMARKLLAEKGRKALYNPHVLSGRMCGCGQCFCCAAKQVYNELLYCSDCGHHWAEHIRTANASYACHHYGCGCRDVCPPTNQRASGNERRT